MRHVMSQQDMQVDPQELATVQDIYNHEAAEGTGTVSNQTLRFRSQAAALQAQWGTLYPPHMVKGSKSAVAYYTAQPTVIYLPNSNSSRYRILEYSLSSNVLGGEQTRIQPNSR